MEINGTNIKQKLSNKYCCEKCNYFTDRKSNIDNHLLSAKHKKEINGSNFKQELSNNFCCEKCNKIYQTPGGLWKHKKKCNQPSIINSNTDSIDKDKLILMLIKQNSELIKETSEFKSIMIEQQNTMMKVIENGTHNITNNNPNINNTINSHNKTFNLQFFLNETCKNAMNINEFVDSIKLQLSDLENVAKIGYIEGISKIIIKNLNALDVTERPVHCSDSKRDTMYVKDNNKWEKENENNEKVLKAIEDIADKNRKLVKEWKIKNPECASSKSHKADVYSHIMIQAVCSNNDTNNTKILKKIAKEVTIDKNQNP
jgi:hypothetical protein